MSTFVGYFIDATHSLNNSNSTAAQMKHEIVQSFAKIDKVMLFRTTYKCCWNCASSIFFLFRSKILEMTKFTFYRSHLSNHIQRDFFFISWFHFGLNFCVFDTFICTNKSSKILVFGSTLAILKNFPFFFFNTTQTIFSIIYSSRWIW